MKIRIEFTLLEKEVIENSLDINIKNDINKNSTMKCGTVEYNKDKNYIEVNFKELFIISYSALIGRSVRTVIELFKSFTVFFDEWFKVEKTEESKSEEKPSFEKMMEYQKDMESTRVDNDDSPLGTDVFKGHEDLMKEVLD